MNNLHLLTEHYLKSQFWKAVFVCDVALRYLLDDQIDHDKDEHIIFALVMGHQLPVILTYVICTHHRYQWEISLLCVWLFSFVQFSVMKAINKGRQRLSLAILLSILSDVCEFAMLDVFCLPWSPQASSVRSRDPNDRNSSIVSSLVYGNTSLNLGQRQLKWKSVKKPKITIKTKVKSIETEWNPQAAAMGGNVPLVVVALDMMASGIAKEVSFQRTKIGNNHGSGPFGETRPQ